MSSSGHLCTGQMRALWEHNHHPIPAFDELPPAVRESVLDPLIPAKVDDLAQEDRGLVWLYQQGWTTLYGVVALEVFGHMDPRIIESGEMFVHVVTEFAPKLGLADDIDAAAGDDPRADRPGLAQPSLRRSFDTRSRIHAP